MDYHYYVNDFCLDIKQEEMKFEPIIEEEHKHDPHQILHSYDHTFLKVYDPRDNSKHSEVKERRSKKITDPSLRIGHWTYEEKKKYHWFLEVYHTHFENKQLRRMDKIFKTMADTLGTRAADQCRSHHQKMEKKYKTFYNIIHKLRNIHYQTADAVPLEKEIKESGVQPHDGIISEEYLTLKLSTYVEQPKVPRTPQSSPRKKHQRSPQAKCEDMDLYSSESDDQCKQEDLSSDREVQVKKEEEYERNLMEKPLDFFADDLSEQLI